MATQNSQQQTNQGDDWLWIVLGLSLLLFVVWFMKHEWIVNVSLRLRWAETSFLGFFLSDSQAHANNMASVLISREKISSIHFREYWSEWMAAGVRPFAVFFGALLCYFAVQIILKNKRGKVKRKLDMGALMDYQSEEFPYIRPVLGLDLINDTSPQWAPAMRPESQFDAKGKLVERGFVDKHELIESRLFDRKKAADVFIKQIGRKWPSGGWKKLKKHEMALFGIFAARVMRDKDGSRDALKAIAYAFGPGGDKSFAPGIELAKRYGEEGDVKAIIGRHRYVTSVLAGLLEDARIEGVLPSSEFLWLKPVDRNLWYLLNSVGRRVAPIEASGSFCNFLAEKIVFKSNTMRADKLEKRRQKEAAIQLANERNLSLDDETSDVESSIPEPVVLVGPVVDEAVEALYTYMKEKDLCE